MFFAFAKKSRPFICKIQMPKIQLNKAGKDGLMDVIPLLWKQRELMFGLARRDIQVKYKQTFLGLVWMFLNPLLMALIFTFFFSQIIHFTQVKHSTIYVLSGYLGWYIFANTFQQCASVLKDSESIIEKIHIHRIVLVFSRCFSVSIEHFVFVLLVFLFGLFSGQINFTNLWLLPFAYLFSSLTALGFVCFVAGISIFRKDFLQIVPHFIQIAIWMTPVFYAKEMLPQSFLWLLNLNPFVGFIEFWRYALYAEPLNWTSVLLHMSALFLFSLLSFRYFVKRERLYLEQL